MAYSDPDNAFTVPARSRSDAIVAAGLAGFTAPEWSVIVLARNDTMGSLAAPGRLSRALRNVIGQRTAARLADPKLEALRRLAVHAWRRGFALPMAEIDNFVSAGFTERQIETLVTHVTGAWIGTGGRGARGMNMIAPIEVQIAQPDPLRKRASRLPRWQRTTAILLPAALLGVIGVKVFGSSGAVAVVPPPADVTVANPLVRDVSEWDDYVGRFAPSRSVELRPRVAGEVTGIHFRDGQIVSRGQLLFTIDARPFAAALAEARANAAIAQSSLVLARTDLARAQRLIADEAVSAGEVDALRGKQQAAEAAFAAANARVRARALDVSFTQVRAPIGGRISDRRVDAGNQVAGGEGAGGTLLTTINALDPIYFTFDGSEALYLKTQRARQPGAAPAVVEIQLQDEAEHRWKGKLDFTDNGLDQRSGTIRGRAVLTNPGYFLTPGMFGNMRLAGAGTKPALLIPDDAVQTDQARKVVLVVDRNNVVAQKPVVLGPVVDGLRIVRSGLVPSDRIVITGTQMAMPGATVKPKAGRIAVREAAAAPTVVSPIAGGAVIISR